YAPSTPFTDSVMGHLGNMLGWNVTAHTDVADRLASLDDTLDPLDLGIVSFDTQSDLEDYAYSSYLASSFSTNGALAMMLTGTVATD
ncbi:hypothetical protein KIPB_016846, partial [Kipferlia bialata]